MSKKEMLLVVAVVVACALAAAVAALAAPVQQFDLQVRSPHPDGQVAVRLQLRAYDTTGAVPPEPTSLYLRLPAGVAVRRQFLTSHWFCDGPALRDALDRHPSGIPFTQRIEDLEPFIRSLAHDTSKAGRAALANARVCERARLGGGTGLIDARDVTPVLADPIPVKFTEFLSRGTAPGSVMGFTILGAAIENAPIVHRFPVVAGVHAAITDSLVSDPTPDGLYGYKLVFDTGPISGFKVSIAEADTTVHGLELAKGACLRRDRHGRCRARQRADTYLFGAPACPSSGQLSALMFSSYAAPTPSITTTLQLPCPRFTP